MTQNAFFGPTYPCPFEILVDALDTCFPLLSCNSGVQIKTMKLAETIGSLSLSFLLTFSL
jgi:hypothetical protein